MLTGGSSGTMEAVAASRGAGTGGSSGTREAVAASRGAGTGGSSSTMEASGGRSSIPAYPNMNHCPAAGVC